VSEVVDERRLELRGERARVAPYRGQVEIRIILTFAAQAVAWTTVLVLGMSGAIPLWIGLVVNTVLASMFYMPLHEATHGNILGDRAGSRWIEDLIGMLSAIPVGISYKAHRESHMRHHAFTNDHDRDPDHYTDGPLVDLPAKWLSVVMMSSLLPLFAFVPATRNLVHPEVRHTMSTSEAPDGPAAVWQFRFWLLTHAALVAAFFLGVGWAALLLWYVPARLQALWLLFIFAWYPHHPADTAGRYLDTRVAVFPGSTWLIRGHDHHALHHLFPRVPHFRLPGLWQEIGPEMTAKGVRTEGRALGATGPIVW
jgi:beta-carotene hydroxylase